MYFKRLIKEQFDYASSVKHTHKEVYVDIKLNKTWHFAHLLVKVLCCSTNIA